MTIPIIDRRGQLYGKDIDRIYELTLRTRADLIKVGAKSKSLTATLFTDEMADNLAEYHFGVPVLIHKKRRSISACSGAC